MNKKFDKLGFYPADILLPKGQDMNKWAVVACDQFTSEPEYWQAVEKKVGDAPSTLRLILPEANLKAPNVDEYIENINNAMKKYLADGVFETLPDSLIYIERQQSDGKAALYGKRFLFVRVRHSFLLLRFASGWVYCSRTGRGSQRGRRRRIYSRFSMERCAFPACNPCIILLEL